MAKKEYTSLFIRVEAFASEDVLTASATVQTGKYEDGSSYIWGSFSNDWLSND